MTKHTALGGGGGGVPCGAACGRSDATLRCERCAYAVYCSERCRTAAKQWHAQHCAASVPDETTHVVWRHQALRVGGGDGGARPPLPGVDAPNVLCVDEPVAAGTLLLMEHCVAGTDPSVLCAYVAEDEQMQTALARHAGSLFAQVCAACVPESERGGVALGRLAAHVGYRGPRANAAMPCVTIDCMSNMSPGPKYPLLSHVFVALYADTDLAAGDAVTISHAAQPALRSVTQHGFDGPARCFCGVPVVAHHAATEARVRQLVEDGDERVEELLSAYASSTDAARTLVAQRLARGGPSGRARGETYAERVLGAWRNMLDSE